MFLNTSLGPAQVLNCHQHHTADPRARARARTEATVVAVMLLNTHVPPHHHAAAILTAVTTADADVTLDDTASLVSCASPAQPRPRDIDRELRGPNIYSRPGSIP